MRKHSLAKPVRLKDVSAPVWCRGEDEDEVVFALSQNPNGHFYFEPSGSAREGGAALALLDQKYVLEIGSRKIVPLDATNFISADAEMRNILAARGWQIGTSIYWYSLDGAGQEIQLCIEDCDPLAHTHLSLGALDAPHFRRSSRQSAAYLLRLSASGLCASVAWGGSDRLDVYLTPDAADRANRLATFESLMRLYYPED